MGRNKIERTDEQKKALADFVAAYKDYRKGKRTALERAKLAAEAQVAELRRTAAVLARAAVGKGIPLRDIGREGMHTSNYTTIRELIGEADILEMRANAVEFEARAAEELKRSEIVVETLGEGRYKLTLDGAELEDAKRRSGWQQGVITDEHRSAELATHASGELIPATDPWIADLAEQHPVVLWFTVPTNREKVKAKLAELESERDAA